ncbi:glycosyltransferase family 4 protein [Candidatus Peregrinibacteria bacterium]|nr:glycosyltransferase family 4 protein [Candidatus Peregrinibacteria bacterium]
MKIGINARFLAHPFTGIGQYTYNLLRALSSVDKRNEYLLFTPELVDIQLSENFKQVRIPEAEYKSASLRKAHWEHVLIPREIEKWGIELAHFLYPSNPKKSLKIPTIVTVHDVIPWVLPAYRKHMRSKVYSAYTKMALKKADHIITVSDFSKDEIKRVLKVEDKNIHVIYLAPPMYEKDKVAPPNLHLRRDFLLYVGGYDDRKNVPSLIEAYQKFIANHYKIDLILVGGKGHNLEELITDEYCDRVAGVYLVKPKGKIIFTEPLPSNELTALYKQATALVHVSNYEGFNLPLVEAMTNGLPVVASDIPVNHEVTAENAHFIDQSWVDTIGIGIHEFLNNKAMQRELKKGGLERSKDFSWKKCAEETLYVYNLFT